MIVWFIGFNGMKGYFMLWEICYYLDFLNNCSLKGDAFGFFIQRNIKLHGSFNAKTIIEDGQYCYY